MQISPRHGVASPARHDRYQKSASTLPNVAETARQQRHGAAMRAERRDGGIDGHVRRRAAEQAGAPVASRGAVG